MRIEPHRRLIYPHERPERLLTNPYYQGPPSDHFDGTRFFLPGLPPSDKNLLDILRWKMKERSAHWPKRVPSTSGIVPAARVSGLTITHIGHASTLIQVAGCNLLFDPVWSKRVSPISFAGPRRHNPPAVAFSDLPPIGCILLSHNHYDHMDVQTIERLWRRDRPLILTPLGNDAILRRAVAEIEVTTGDWWESFGLPHGLRATILPAYHWSSRSLRDRRMALWGGFMLEAPAGNIYCAGDTALRDGAIFHQIADRFDPPAVALLPIGAYAPRWFMRTQHADPSDAIQIAQICAARQALGIHWGTFQLTDEQWDDPEQKLESALCASGLPSAQFLPFHPGDVWTQVEPEPHNPSAPDLLHLTRTEKPQRRTTA